MLSCLSRATNFPDAARDHRSQSIPKLTAARSVLVGLMDRYLCGLLDPFVTLLEVHKLMYFMPISGEPLQLKYVKGPYGPYAENLRHVLNAVEGYMISGYADGGDRPDKQLQIVPGALSEALNVINSDTEIQKRFERVSDLVEGFESPFGMELLSTVHWVAHTEQVQSVDDGIARIYAWNERKKGFSRRQIELAFTVLSRKGWIPGNFASGPE